MLSKLEPNVVVEAKYVVYSVGLIPMIEHGEPDVHVVEFNAVMMVPVIKFKPDDMLAVASIMSSSAVPDVDDVAVHER